MVIIFDLEYYFILGCIYCNKWQEAQLFEFVPNQKSKTIELKEKIEKSEELLSSTECSSPVTIPISSEDLTLKNDQNTTLDYSEIHEDISQKSDDHIESFKQEHSMNMHSYSSIPETDNLVKSKLNKTSIQENKKKGKRKGFLQMRIDSTIYFDNMGYSYQIQNEKNDKK